VFRNHAADRAQRPAGAGDGDLEAARNRLLRLAVGAEQGSCLRRPSPKFGVDRGHRRRSVFGVDRGHRRRARCRFSSVLKFRVLQRFALGIYI
jgi:hypothetical protein